MSTTAVDSYTKTMEKRLESLNTALDKWVKNTSPYLTLRLDYMPRGEVVLKKKFYLLNFIVIHSRDIYLQYGDSTLWCDGWVYNAHTLTDTDIRSIVSDIDDAIERASKKITVLLDKNLKELSV